MKRGMSAVISSLIFVLLVLIAIGLIWVVINKVIHRGATDISLASQKVDLEIVDSTVSINYTTSIANFRIDRNEGEGNLIKTSVVLEDETGKTYVVTKPFSVAIYGGEYFEVNFASQGLGKLKKISVYPVVGNGNDERTLEMTDDHIFAPKILPYCGDCLIAEARTGCEISECETAVCDIDPYCCGLGTGGTLPEFPNGNWDSYCVDYGDGIRGARNLCVGVSCRN